MRSTGSNPIAICFIGSMLAAIFAAHANHWHPVLILAVPGGLGFLNEVAFQHFIGNPVVSDILDFSEPNTRADETSPQ